MALARSLRVVQSKLKKMEKDNKENMEKFPHLKFEELPDSYSQPENIISKSQYLYLYLKVEKSSFKYNCFNTT